VWLGEILVTRFFYALELANRMRFAIFMCPKGSHHHDTSFVDFDPFGGEFKVDLKRLAKGKGKGK